MIDSLHEAARSRLVLRSVIPLAHIEIKKTNKAPDGAYECGSNQLQLKRCDIKRSKLASINLIY